ncbi:MAG TPA: hypothetical protein VKF37_17145 [Chloroflexota bacterium]|nr:hypothetical protein [Chloroflexota bacterium]
MQAKESKCERRRCYDADAYVPLVAAWNKAPLRKQTSILDVGSVISAQEALDVDNPEEQRQTGNG